MKLPAVLSLLLVCSFGLFAQVNIIKDGDGNLYPVKKMPDNKVWMTQNLQVKIPGSYCYDNDEANCKKYGRLYTWKVAQDVCKQLGDGWRLPAEADWWQLGKQYGGVHADSTDGKAAYAALMPGGKAAFNLQLAGGRNSDGSYGRKDAHGFYWTATETDSTHAWMYNFGTGAKYMNRHNDGEKGRAFAVRCIHD